MYIEVDTINSIEVSVFADVVCRSHMDIDDAHEFLAGSENETTVIDLAMTRTFSDLCSLLD